MYSAASRARRRTGSCTDAARVTSAAGYGSGRDRPCVADDTAPEKLRSASQLSAASVFSNQWLVGFAWSALLGRRRLAGVAWAD